MKGNSPGAPTPQRRAGLRVWFLRVVALGALWFLIHTAVSAVVGIRDDIGNADVIVVFGNKVHVDGTVSKRLKARLDRAWELHSTGKAPAVIVSGGLGYEGHEEALVMRQYLINRGIPGDAIIVDKDGYDTYRTARNGAAFMSRQGLSSAILVTQYYHIVRARMAFRAFGVKTLHHACAKMGPEPREPLTLVREFLAFYYYLSRYPFSSPRSETAATIRTSLRSHRKRSV